MAFEKKIHPSGSTPTAYAALILRESLAEVSNAFYLQEQGYATGDPSIIENFHRRSMKLYTCFEKQIIEKLEGENKDLHESFLQEILNNCQYLNLFVGIYIVEHSFWDEQLFRDSEVELVRLFHSIQDRLLGKYILRIKSPDLIKQIIQALAPEFPSLRIAEQDRLVPIFQAMTEEQRKEFFPGISLREKPKSIDIHKKYELFRTESTAIDH